MGLVKVMRRKFLLCFCHIPNPPWYYRFLKGYNHVYAYEQLSSDCLVLLDPLHDHLHLKVLPTCIEDIRPLLDHESCYLEVQRNKQPRLIGLKFQTCATFLQYLCGFNVHAYTAQGLYNALKKIELRR